VFAQNSTLHLNVDADHGELKIDGASSIDSIGLHTHFKAMYLSYDLIDSNFSYLDGTKSMIQLMNENFIANVKLYTTMPTSEEFYVHYT
jgi:hypothetical protein